MSGRVSIKCYNECSYSSSVHAVVIGECFAEVILLFLDAVQITAGEH